MPETYAVSVSVVPAEVLPSGTKAVQTASVRVHVTRNGEPALATGVQLGLEAVSNPGHAHAAAGGGAVCAGYLALPVCVTDNGGNCEVTYQAAQAAATVKITAELAGHAGVKGEATVQVKVNLGSFASSGNGYVFEGQVANHGGNTYGAGNLVSAGAAIAQRYADYVADLSPEQQAGVATRLRFTDASLEWGGLYDIHSNWVPPHHYHRYGRDLDIAVVGLDIAGNRVGVHIESLEVATEEILHAQVQTSGFPLSGGILDEGDHYHIRVLEVGGGE